MTKLAIPQGSEFSRYRAIELADLIERAYQQYDAAQENPAQKLFQQGTLINRDGGDLAYEILQPLFFTETILLPETLPFGFILRRIRTDGIPEIFIIFRGTRDGSEWIENLQSIRQVPFSLGQNLGLVGKGFHEIYTSDQDGTNQGHASIALTISETLRNPTLCPPNAQVFIAGHSLGGALSSLAGLHVATATAFKPNIYLFASPRTGDRAFAQQFLDRQIACYRIVNSEDVVPTLPMATKRVIGEEMTRHMSVGRGKTIDALYKIIGFLTGGATTYDYEHIGEPIYFTWQRGAVSYNHNMLETYRAAIETFA